MTSSAHCTKDDSREEASTKWPPTPGSIQLRHKLSSSWLRAAPSSARLPRAATVVVLQKKKRTHALGTLPLALMLAARR
jgi:hypothetical protein